MKDHKHPVDDFFKESLQDHQVQPSDAAKQRFLHEAATILTPRNRVRNRWLLFLSVFVVISSIAFLLWFPEREQPEDIFAASDTALSPTQSPSTAVPDSPVKPQTSMLSPAPDSPVTPQTSMTSPAPDSPVTPQTSMASPAPDSPVSLQTPITSPKPDVSGSPQASTTPLPAHPASSVLNQTKPPDFILTDSSNEEVDHNRTDSIVSINPTVEKSQNPRADTVLQKAPDTTQSISERKPGSGEKRDKRGGSHWNMALSASYSPEWMFNTLEGTKYINNFGIEGTLQKGKYLLRAGVGLTYTSGANEMLVEYNDYLGSYQHLDSIAFHWDEKNYHLLPTYYTSQQDVWDSLRKLDYPTIQKRYTYLQIPVILGYDLISKKTFSFGFRAGQILSLLIATRQLTPDYDPLRNKVIQINNITIDRIESNWQVLAGVNFSWHINQRITLELEPLARYYFTSVYEKTDISKKVWSFGFRTAITFIK